MPSLRCKAGVTPPILWIAAAITRLKIVMPQITITAGTNGDHMTGSLHYVSAALDLRTKDFPSYDAKLQFVTALKKELGQDYQVLFESVGADNEHVHVQYRPAPQPIGQSA